MVSKPTTRLLAALELLQSRGRVTGPELPAQLQVHLRTVRRCVVALVAIGVPVVAERGRDGAYLLTPGFRLPPMMFSDDEALALAIGLLAARELGLASTRIAVASAQAKLERVMPVALKSRLRAIDQTVRLDLQRPAATADSRALATLSEAAQRQQRVLLHYRSPQQVDTERQFDCFGLAFYAGHWYAVGHCHLRHGLRSFRLDRVQRAAPLPASFGAPPPFDALAYLKHSIATPPQCTAYSAVQGKRNSKRAPPAGPLASVTRPCQPRLRCACATAWHSCVPRPVDNSLGSCAPSPGPSSSTRKIRRPPSTTAVNPMWRRAKRRAL